MQVSVKSLKESFANLYKSILNKDFCKSQGYCEWTERHLLPLVRFYLLGRYQSVTPEYTCSSAVAQERKGRIDFIVGNTAVEFAVRTPSCPPQRVKSNLNRSEVIKLMQYPGPSVLVLFDFSANPLSRYDLEEYRSLPSMGRGNWFKSPFSILYYCRDCEGIRCEPLRIRV